MQQDIQLGVHVGMAHLQTPAKREDQGYVGVLGARRLGSCRAGIHFLSGGEGVGGNSACERGVVVDIVFEDVEEGVGEFFKGAIDIYW